MQFRHIEILIADCSVQKCDFNLSACEVNAPFGQTAILVFMFVI